MGKLNENQPWFNFIHSVSEGEIQKCGWWIKNSFLNQKLSKLKNTKKSRRVRCFTKISDFSPFFKFLLLVIQEVNCNHLGLSYIYDDEKGQETA
ncbi:hypothetical protein TSAR_003653 [Trichomalopsis sarcophagae]|uniref:Uncharacterized protein n=1 Tax=Trichomalopsis sarcophagae TaxID=543379 RepID=A0A232F9N1_9HYME|nr:hypothetical protein TSAR_003653 [Trichomalopsis sarcophagae]